MWKANRKKLILLFLFIFCSSMICGCMDSSTKETNVFSYKDLTEKDYITNAHDFWEEMLSYLKNKDETDLKSALEKFGETNKPAVEKITASEMVMLFHEYLLKSSGETIESINAMSEQERDTFQKENQNKIKEEIPNAFSVQQATMRKKQNDEGVIGTFNFKDREKLTFYEDGSYLISAVN